MLDERCFKCENELLGERLNGRTAGPGLLDNDLPSVRADAEAGKRRGRFAELLAEGFERPAQAPRGRAARDHALQCLQHYQIGEIVKPVAPARFGRDQFQARPIVKLAPGDAKYARNFIASESLPHHDFRATVATLWKLSGSRRKNENTS